MNKILFVIIILISYSVLSGQSLISSTVTDEVKVNNMKGINTPDFEFGPAFYGEGLAFVYSLKKKKKSLFDNKTKSTFFDLGFYFPNSSAEPYDNSAKMQTFDEQLNSDFHEGPMSFFKTYVCYFTRENADIKKAKKRKNNQTRLQIYLSKSKSKKWQEPKLLDFCNPEYNYCHPTISKDGNTMIFASDKPGGFGKMDLYMAFKDGRKWVESHNLGSAINGPGNDWFPFYYRDSIIFFASNRADGLGGLDVYVTQLHGNNWTEPMILPQPFNSDKDDLGLIVKEDGKSGYFTSSRAGGLGNDDIYYFKSNNSIMFNDNYTEFMFTVTEKDTKSELGQAKLKILPNIGMLTKGQSEFEANNFGIVWGFLDKNHLQSLQFSKYGYKDYTIKIDPKYDNMTLDISLERDLSVTLPSTTTLEPSTTDNPISKPSIVVHTTTRTTYSPDIAIPIKAGSKIVFNNIYYASNQFMLQPESTSELEALIDMMTTNPHIRIMLTSYTDAVGSDEDNMILSQKRANSVKNYLLSAGIESSRIMAIGMGETNILNGCTNGIHCSEEDNKINRRTEVEIL